MSAVALEPVGATTSTPLAGPVLRVDLSAVAANTAAIAARTDTDLMAVVKADGMGLGAVDVARTALAHGAGWLGVTTVAEALALRGAGIDVPVLSWLTPSGAGCVEAYVAAVLADVDVAVPTAAHLAALEQAATLVGRTARAHLHLDTGVARDGCEPQRWAALCTAARAGELRGALDVVGVMGHLPCSEDPDHPSNTTGRRRFRWGLGVATTAGLSPRHRHLAATAVVLSQPGAHHTLVRVGIGLLGVDPGDTLALTAPLTLTAPLVMVRQVRAGTPVGYGAAWSAPARTRLGLLPVGYADGLPRSASGRAEVMVRGRRCPVVGRIAMDQTVVDLGEAGEAVGHVEAGERVTVLGPGAQGEPTLAEWARWSGTITAEVLCGLGASARLHRVVVPAHPPTTSSRPATGGLRSVS